MNLRQLHFISIGAFCLTLFLSCDSEIKFDKSKWASQSDLKQYPYRDKMLNDLIENHKLKGLSHQDLIVLLGPPEQNMMDSSHAVYYNIITDFGLDIDPVYTKTLVINLGTDSVVADFQIYETRN